MTNYWHYTAIFSPQDSIPVGIRHALQCAEEHGYEPINPWTERLEGMQSSGLAELAFDTSEDAIDYLAAEGGLLVLWKNETDITMTISRARLINAHSLYEISFGVGNYLLHIDEDKEGSIAVAKDARSVFLDVCDRVDALYSYCVDEYLIEYLLENYGLPVESLRSRIIEIAVTEGPPAFLFWLQYFSAQYGQEPWVERLAEMGGKVEKRQNGFVLSFFDWPWEQQRSNKLEDLNRQWWDHYHNGGRSFRVNSH